jgi:predicted RNA binding protein YcfA (HicA-like mRNA interferase family)
VLKALRRIGWHEDERISDGSHRQLVRDGYEAFTWAFHDGVEIGPRMLARIAKHTGLKPEDL